MNGIRRGERWEEPVGNTNTVEVRGGDAELAAAARANPAALFWFVPDRSSSVAETLGLSRSGGSGRHAVALDRLDVRIDGGLVVSAVASVICGVSPDRLAWRHRRRRYALSVDGRQSEVSATGIGVFNAQHLNAHRVVKRGHPGDGRFEVQWYGVPPADRSELRRRLATGDHVDHDLVGTRTARALVIDSSRGFPITVDQVGYGRCRRVEVDLVAGAVQLVV